MLGDPDEGTENVGREIVVDNVEEAGSPVVVEGGGDKEEDAMMIEAEIIVLDDITSDDKDTPADERLVRRQFRRLKSLGDAAAVREVKQSDSEETEDNLPLNNEIPAVDMNIVGETLEEHYESERKRKGKQEARSTTKRPRQTSAPVRV